MTDLEKEILDCFRMISTLGYENVTKDELYGVITELRYKLQNKEKVEAPN